MRPNPSTHTNTHAQKKTVANVSFCSSSPVEGPGTIVGDVAGEFGDEIPELVKRISACTKCSGYVSLFCYIIQYYFQHRNMITGAVREMQIINFVCQQWMLVALQKYFCFIS